MNDRKRLAELDKRHAYYYDFNQAEGRDDALMASTGHPFAEDYRTLRGVFDSLRYCSNASERFLYFKDDREHATYHAPELCVDLGYLYPAHPQWLTRVADLAAKGWPESCEPELSCGDIRVRTASARLVGALFAVAGGFPVERSENGFWSIRIEPKDAKTALKVLATLKRRMKRWWLPARTEADTIADAIPLDLANKRFSLANVDRVTEADHAILVPLVAIKSNAEDQVARIAEDLIAICRRGYPWRGPVRDWCSQFLVKRFVAKMDREFKASVDTL